MQVQAPHVGRVVQRRVAAEFETRVTTAAAVVAGEQATRRARDAIVKFGDSARHHTIAHGAATAARMPLIRRGVISCRCNSYTGW